MNNKIKAPDALAGDLSAIEINHLQDKPDYDCCQYPVDPVIPELIKVMHRGDSVKISERTFFNWFCFGSYDVDGSGRHRATAGGVEFYCLVEKEEKRDV